ncbi:MAG TPA: alkaline phosphatase family protein [Anaerolineales bacterium]
MNFFPPSKHLSIIILAALLLSACSPSAPLATPIPAASLVPPPTNTTHPTIPPPTVTLTPTSTITPAPSLTPGPVAKRVLILSMDGLRPDAISMAPMPNLQALMQVGAYTLTAQTIFPSATLPAHASMLLGLCPSKHGVDWNDYLPQKGYAKGTGLFDLAHTAGLKTVMYIGKEKLRQLVVPASVDISRYINDRDVVMAQRITEEFPEDFGLLFVHFATPDAMGHAYGWMSPQYLSVVRRADEALGTLLKDLDDHGLRQETLIIVTADHGGHAQMHGTRQTEDMTIPWVVSGPGVRPGQLTTPIQITDTAATAAWALDLPRPSDWDGWPVYEAFGQIIQPRPAPFCE